MKTGDMFTVERCLTGYIVRTGRSVGARAMDIGETTSVSERVRIAQSIAPSLRAFSHKEHVLDFLRKALTLDCETGLAKEVK